MTALMTLIDPLPELPVTAALEGTYAGRTQDRVCCPWCVYDTSWRIWWIAAWGQLSDHVVENHRAMHEAVRARRGMRPLARAVVTGRRRRSRRAPDLVR